MFFESLNMDIFVKPRRRANFETYDTALDGHCATRAFAVYAAPVLPVVVEFGFRVRGVRVSHWGEATVASNPATSTRSLHLIVSITWR